MNKKEFLTQQLSQRILFLDGAMGTMIQGYHLEEQDYRGKIQSVLAALIGVQSEANRERDFEHGSLPSFLIVGVIATVLFILILVTIVAFIL
jgi:hypothetical protein